LETERHPVSPAETGGATGSATPTGPVAKSGTGAKATFATVLRNPRYLLLWLAQLISDLGDAFAAIAALILVTDFTRSAVAISALMFLQLVPMVVAGPIIGVFVDRWDRKKILIASDVVRGLLWLALALHPTLAALYPAVFVSTLASLFFRPARGAIIPELVGDEQMRAAVGLAQSTTQFTGLLGPIVGGALVGFFGTGAVFGINAASFLASALVIVFIAIPEAARFPKGRQAKGTSGAETAAATGPRSSFRSELGTGLRFIRSDVVLWFLIILFGCFGLVAQLAGVAAIDYLRNTIALSPGRFGLVMTAQGLGAVLGAVITGNLAGRLRSGPAAAWGFVALLGLFGLFFLHPGFAVLPLLFGLIGMLETGFNVPLTSVFYRRTPPEVRGRVFSVANSLMNGLGLGTLPLAGFVVAWLGSAATLGWVGVIGVATMLLGLTTRGGKAFLRER